MSDLEALADTVRSARKAKKWGQQELADRAHVSLGVVNNLERAKTRPQPANLRSIFGALDLETEENGREEETRSWPPDVAVALDVIGLVLTALPEQERSEKIKQLTRQLLMVHPPG